MDAIDRNSDENRSGEMSEKWMVYDTASGDIVFHDSEEKAQKDYDYAVSMIEEGDRPYKVYLFEVKKESDVSNE